MIHEIKIALIILSGQSLVLVQIGRAHTAEIDQTGLFAGDQLAVQRQRGEWSTNSRFL